MMEPLDPKAELMRLADEYGTSNYRDAQDRLGFHSKPTQTRRAELESAITLALADARRSAELERDQYKRRLTAMFPLFEEARDALTAISLSSAKLHNIDLSLANRMDDVGDPKRWALIDEKASGT